MAAIDFLRSALSRPVLFGNTHSPEHRGMAANNSRAARPRGRSERPFLVRSRRKQDPAQSISDHRSPHASSRRIPVRAMSLMTDDALGLLMAAASIALP